MIRFILICLTYCFCLNAVDLDYLRGWNERALRASQIYQTNIVQEDEKDSFLDPLTDVGELYSAVEHLGNGIRGHVFLRVTKDGRSFAVKQIDLPADTIKQEIQAFQHEFGVGVNLQHPSVVKVHNAVIKAESEDADMVQAYLFMECAPGERLARVMLESDEDRLVLLTHYLDAVIFAFEKGIIPYGIHGGDVYVDQPNRKLTLLDLQLYQWAAETKIDCFDFYNELNYVIRFFAPEQGAEEFFARKQAWQRIFKEDKAFSKPLTPDHARLLKECFVDLRNALKTT